MDVCDDRKLVLDEWLLVLYKEMDKEIGWCLFSGGFNLKMCDFDGNVNGCNFMEFFMRLEIECIVGEGMIFDFWRSECIYFVLMNIY